MSTKAKVGFADDDKRRSGSIPTVTVEDVERGQPAEVIKLEKDKPTTFLAMNLNPLDVRKSNQHFDSMAAKVEETFNEMENYSSQIDNLADLYDDSLDVGDTNTKPSNAFLHPNMDRTSQFRQSMSGSISIPVNKMSIKLYGSEKAVEKEQERLKDAGMFIIHPYSNFRFLWDSLSLLMLLVNIILIPVSIAFWNETHIGWIQFKGGGTHTTASGMKAFNLLRLAKILALLRLLRLSRFIRYMKQWEEIFNFQYEMALALARIINLIMLMLFICHVNGCLQYMVPMFLDFPPDTWAAMHNLTEKFKNVTVWERYSWAVFKSTSHMLCIGYGREPPAGLIDVWVTFFSMVSGAMCFAMFIGNATSLIQSMDSSKRAYKEKYSQVKEYMQFRKLPSDLRHRISDYYENRFQGKMFDEDHILTELNHNLRQEVINYNCRDLVSQVPFFHEADPNFLTTVLDKLKFEVYLAGDVIVKEGTVGDKLFFINHGTVIIRSIRHKIEQRLSDGCYFGEIALLQQNMRRIADVIAESYCYMYTLSMDDFNTVLAEFPRQRQKLQYVAASRMNSNDNAKQSTCSVVPLDGPAEKQTKQKSILHDIEEEDDESD